MEAAGWLHLFRKRPACKARSHPRSVLPVEWPDGLGQELEGLWRSSRELVVQGPRRAEYVPAALSGTGSGLQGQDVTEGIRVECLVREVNQRQYLPISNGFVTLGKHIGEGEEHYRCAR